MGKCAMTFLSLIGYCTLPRRLILIGFLTLSDLSLYVCLRIAGPFIRKVLSGRRGLSLLRDLGLSVSTEFMVSGRLPRLMPLVRSRLSCRRPEVQLLLPLLDQPLCVCGDNSGKRCYMHSTELTGVEAEEVDRNGRN